MITLLSFVPTTTRLWSTQQLAKILSTSPGASGTTDSFSVKGRLKAAVRVWALFINFAHIVFLNQSGGASSMLPCVAYLPPLQEATDAGKLIRRESGWCVHLLRSDFCARVHANKFLTLMENYTLFNLKLQVYMDKEKIHWKDY